MPKEKLGISKLAGDTRPNSYNRSNHCSFSVIRAGMGVDVVQLCARWQGSELAYKVIEAVWGCLREIDLRCLDQVYLFKQRSDGSIILILE